MPESSAACQHIWSPTGEERRERGMRYERFACSKCHATVFRPAEQSADELEAFWAEIAKRGDV